MFYSILFPSKEEHERTRLSDVPDCFKDLNLDQIFSPILKRKKEFELDAFFYTSLYNKDIIIYRQDIMKEIEDDTLRSLFNSFSETVYDIVRKMGNIQKNLASDSSYDNNYLTQGRMLDCAEQYVSVSSKIKWTTPNKYLHLLKGFVRVK